MHRSTWRHLSSHAILSVGLGLVAGLQAQAAAPDVAGAPHRPDSGSLDVRCGAVIDGLAAQAVGPATVRIREGRIAAVVDKGTVPISATEMGTVPAEMGTVPALDLGDMTCLPGLIDMHTHLTDRPGDTADLSVYYRRSREDQAPIALENARATLMAGVTTARDVGTYIAWADRDLRDAIDAGRAVGPRMQVAGFYLTVPGGGGDLVIPGHDESEIPPQVRTGVARGPEAFRQKAELAVAGGADFLKVIASGAVLAFGGVPGEPEMTPDELAAVVGVARAHGLRVSAHAHGARSIKEAILAGADTIEHASLIDDEAIALARERQVALSMDVYNGSYIDSEGRAQGWPEEFLRKNLETTEAQRQGFAKAHAAGVPIVYGTDAAVYPHGLNARQFTVMVERGMTPMQAIQSATSVAARYLGWSNRVGALEPGRYGDLVAVRCRPLEDIACLQQVAVVVKGGLVFKAP